MCDAIMAWNFYNADLCGVCHEIGIVFCVAISSFLLCEKQCPFGRYAQGEKLHVPLVDWCSIGMVHIIRHTPICATGHVEFP